MTSTISMQPSSAHLGCLLQPYKTLQQIKKVKLQRGHLHLLWLVVPILVYILLYSLNPLIQAAFSNDHKTCAINFIARADLCLFGTWLYRYIPRIENPVVDILTAIPYLAHFALPFAYSAWLCFVQRKFVKFLQFILAFGLMCATCTIMQQVLPTPPPWMISPRKLPPEAGFHRVDRLLGMTFFSKLYGSCPLACGAFPSMHAAWPALILFVRSWVSPWFAVAHVVWIGFAAVYSVHHYVIDVVFGVAMAWCFARLARYIVLHWLIPRLPAKRETLPTMDSEEQLLVAVEEGLREDVVENLDDVQMPVCTNESFTSCESSVKVDSVAPIEEDLNVSVENLDNCQCLQSKQV